MNMEIYNPLRYKSVCIRSVGIKLFFFNEAYILGIIAIFP